MINFYFIACLKLFIYNKITHSSIYIEGVRKQLHFFSYVLGENREREQKVCKENKRIRKTTESSGQGQKREQKEKDLCRSIRTFFQRINLLRWATPQKVKICLGGFNLVAFCVL